ncbi:MAG: hypothetical protein J7521_05160 [Caulobacter sp.]|nr:hypothetical protein [Caulobacter sp.]
MNQSELKSLIERHREELDALGARLGGLRSGETKVHAKTAEGETQDVTDTHISELERLELWLTENVARFEALLGA